MNCEGKDKCKCKTHNDHDVEFEEGFYVCLDCEINVAPHYYCKRCGYDEVGSDLVSK